MPRDRRRKFDQSMARHETINMRFKQFAILGQRYRHNEAGHEDIFRCIAVLIQLDILSGNLAFPVR